MADINGNGCNYGKANRWVLGILITIGVLCVGGIWAFSSKIGEEGRMERKELSDEMHENRTSIRELTVKVDERLGRHENLLTEQRELLKDIKTAVQNP